MTISVTSQDFSNVEKRMMHDDDVKAAVINNIILKSGTVYNIEIDNNGVGTPTTVYFKIWDSKSPTLGTDYPDHVFAIPAGVKRNISILDGMTIETGLSYACVKGMAYDSAVDPDTTVQVRMIVE